MKAFKKLLILMLSAIMCVSIFSLSACDKKSGGETAFEADPVKALNEMTVDENTAWGLQATLSSMGVTTNVKGLMPLKKDATISDIKLDLNAQMTDGLSTSSMKAYVRVDEQQNINAYVSEDGGLSFVQYVQSLADLEGLTDSESQIEATNDSAMLESILGYIEKNGMFENAIIQYGASVEVANGVQTITIDYVKYLKAIVSDVKDALATVTATTTVNDLYKNEKVKSLIQANLGSADAKTFYNDYVLPLLKSSMGMEDVEGILPAPTDGQSLYDYIQTVLDTDIEGEKLGEMNVGTMILGYKTKIDGVLGVIDGYLTSTTAKISIQIKDKAFQGASFEFATTVNYGMASYPISFSGSLAPSTESFVDVSTLNVTSVENSFMSNDVTSLS